MPLLTVDRISKRFDGPAVRNVSLEIAEGEILCLLGPSGCGKTTLLRLVAGLEMPDQGRILLNGRQITRTPPHRRGFGLMFQEFALFPHRSVFENVAFGLRMHRLKQPKIQQRTAEMLALVGLSGMAHRSVAALSGGERQRVALARSLAPRPALLMLDEPLGALDRALREHLLAEIRSILRKLKITALFVTHDQSEAFGIADRIAVMNAGRLEQLDPPENLYRQPKTVFAARFLGFHNLLPGTLRADGGVETEMGVLTPRLAKVPDAPERVTLVIRPESAALHPPEQPPPDGPLIRGRIVQRVFSGPTFRVAVDTGNGAPLLFDLPNALPPPSAGHAVTLSISRDGLVVIPDPPNETEEV